jgi:hypothetical protein
MTMTARDEIPDLAALDLRKPVRSIGMLGEDAFDGQYRNLEDIASIGDAIIPFTVEAWAKANHAEKDEGTAMQWFPYVNRSLTLAPIHYYADSAGLRVRGCGLDFKIKGAKRANYDIDISIITPYVRLTGDGKAPYLADFADAITKAVGDAARAAYRAMVGPPAEMSIKDAAYAVMKDAYLKASDNGQLPAKARQIMYAARGEILQLTGKKTFSDTYFTQMVLPDYMADNPRRRRIGTSCTMPAAISSSPTPASAFRSAQSRCGRTSASGRRSVQWHNSWTARCSRPRGRRTGTGTSRSLKKKGSMSCSRRFSSPSGTTSRS